jgi:hypothetical protein
MQACQFLLPLPDNQQNFICNMRKIHMIFLMV